MLNLLYRNTSREVLSLPMNYKPLFFLAFKSLPESLFRANFSIALNYFLRDQIVEGRFSEVKNKWINIHITDLDICLYIVARKYFLEVSSSEEDAEAKISLSFESIIDLLSQRTDPDTLFFNRKLSLSGNTETSLALKNILDSIEINEVLPGWIKKVTSLCHKGEMDRNSL